LSKLGKKSLDNLVVYIVLQLKRGGRQNGRAEAALKKGDRGPTKVPSKENVKRRKDSSRSGPRTQEIIRETEKNP